MSAALLCGCYRGLHGPPLVLTYLPMTFGIRSVALAVCIALACAIRPLAAQQSNFPIIHPILRGQPPPAQFLAAFPGGIPSCPALVFDSDTKEYNASVGEEVAPFTFNLTNVWTNEVTIDSVRASCGCTTASMPAVPWHIPPNGGGQVRAQVRLAGKMGQIVKTLTFFTTVGARTVNLKVNIPLPPAQRGMLSQEERRAAMARAVADRQAVFQNDCARCHADRGHGLMGEALYVADCGICHETSHRDSSVPDLHALKQPTSYDYWKAIITWGKPHTMMPAFAASGGGPLTEEQISSLASYLNRTISHNF